MSKHAQYEEVKDYIANTPELSEYEKELLDAPLLSSSEYDEHLAWILTASIDEVLSVAQQVRDIYSQ